MTGPNGWVAYVGPFKYPAGEAASARVAAMAATIAAAGRRVVVVSGSGTQDEPNALISTKGDVHHVSVEDAPDHFSSLPRKLDLVLRSWGAATVAWLDAQPCKPTHVVLYGGLAPFARRVRQWCRRNGVAFLVDVVEWHAPHQLLGGALGPMYLSSEIAMRRIYPTADAAICISTYLAEHLRSRDVDVVIVPPTVTDVIPESDVPMGRTSRDLRLLYFGSAGRKDRVDVIVEAVEDLRARGAGVELTLAGSLPKGLGQSAGCVELGRVAPRAIPQLVRDHDFTVVLRDLRRFTRAGFPTKFVESLANATPVITNLTSDIARHSQDGSDTLHVSECSSRALVETLRRACALDDTELTSMRWHARARALSDFHYTRYVDDVGALLDRSQA
jgi:glycosyltransferase involved in cell wall biosynthesis